LKPVTKQQKKRDDVEKARGKWQGPLENVLSNKFEVSLLLLSFLFVFEGGYEKLAKTRLEQVTAVQS